MNSEQKLIEFIGIPISIKKIAINGHTINYSVSGDGPPLLLIHGANFGWGVWYPNIASLSKNFTVYAIDLPGAGRSTRIDYSRLNPEEDFLIVTEDFIKALGLKNFHIIGFSMGSWVCLQLALKHPEWVDKIIVESAVGFSDYSVASDKIIAFFPLAKLISKIFINPKSRTKVEKFLRGIFYYKTIKLPEEFINYFWETMKTSHNLLFISRLTALHKTLNLENSLYRIKNKTLIIWGEDDKIIPLQKNSHNFKLIPSSEVRLLKNVGHVPSLENPQEFNSVVNKFLLSKI